MTDPVVSVVMAAYRGAHLVRATWASLAAQTFPDFELIVVDDRSPDETLAVLRGIDDPRVHVIAAEENGGPVRARNRAFAQARGRYVAGLDQDDLCLPDRFARQVAYLEANADVVLVAAAAERLTETAVLPPLAPAQTSPALIDWLLALRNPLVWSSVMLRRDAAIAAAAEGAFTRPDRLYAEDFDLYHRLRRIGRIARIDMPLLRYRVHADGASRTGEERMMLSTGAVLAEAHAALFGREAEARGLLLARHIARGIPVADAEGFARLADTIARIHARFIETHALEPRDAARIDAEHARLWWSLARAAVRAGTVPLTRVMAHRPRGMRIGDGRPGDVILSSMIGRGRAFVTARRP